MGVRSRHKYLGPEHPTSAWMRLESTERVMFPKVCSHLCFRPNLASLFTEYISLDFCSALQEAFHSTPIPLNSLSRVIDFSLLADLQQASSICTFSAAFKTNILLSSIGSSTLKDQPEVECWSGRLKLNALSLNSHSMCSVRPLQSKCLAVLEEPGLGN